MRQMHRIQASRALELTMQAISRNDVKGSCASLQESIDSMDSDKDEYCQK